MILSFWIFLFLIIIKLYNILTSKKITYFKISYSNYIYIYVFFFPQVWVNGKVEKGIRRHTTKILASNWSLQRAQILITRKIIIKICKIQLERRRIEGFSESLSSCADSSGAVTLPLFYVVVLNPIAPSLQFKAKGNIPIKLI